MQKQSLFSLLVMLFFTRDSLKNPPPSKQQGFVAKVVDGDTINLQQSIHGTTKVRLLSIDAPESNFRGKSQSPWGEAAKQYLTDLLPIGTKITLITDSESKDNYNRLLAHVHKGKLNINRHMLKQGHAVTYFLYPNQKYFHSYQSAYLEAKQAKRGMWDANDPIHELPFEFRNRIANQSPNKYVGDFDQKKYVQPDQYKLIPIEKRLFFITKSAAKKAGYQPCK